VFILLILLHFIWYHLTDLISTELSVLWLVAAVANLATLYSVWHNGGDQLWLSLRRRLKAETKRYTFNTGNSQVKTVWFSLAFRLKGSWPHPMWSVEVRWNDVIRTLLYNVDWLWIFLHCDSEKNMKWHFLVLVSFLALILKILASLVLQINCIFNTWNM